MRHRHRHHQGGVEVHWSRLSGGRRTLNAGAGALEVTAGWGHAGKVAISMPAKGRALKRDYGEEERQAMGLAVAQLGAITFDIYLNDVAHWQNIPARVWE